MIMIQHAGATMQAKQSARRHFRHGTKILNLPRSEAELASGRNLNYGYNNSYQGSWRLLVNVHVANSPAVVMCIQHGRCDKFGLGHAMVASFVGLCRKALRKKKTYFCCREQMHGEYTHRHPCGVSLLLSPLHVTIRHGTWMRS